MLLSGRDHCIPHLMSVTRGRFAGSIKIMATIQKIVGI